MSEFVSAKTFGRRIPLASATAAQALVQLSLDPSVYEIDYVASARLRGIDVPVCAVTIVRADGRWLLDLAEPKAADVDPEGLRLLALERLGLPTLAVTQADLDVEPRAANCRLVWACRSRRVAPDDRVRILHHLAQQGVSPLVEVAAAARLGDGVASVLALACEDLIELDLTQEPLGPATPVRKRRCRDGS